MSAPAYQYATSPTAIQAEASQGLFTAWQLAADIPQVRKDLMSRHNYQKNFYHMLRELGLGSPLIGPTFAHWELDWIINNFLVGAITTASTGPGTNVTFSLDPTSMYTNTMPGNVTGVFSYLAEMDIITFPDNTKAQVIKGGVNMTANPFLVTVQPLQTTVDLATRLLAGGRYWISDNAFAEGTYGAKPKIPRVYRWSNNTQIIKSNFGESGTSATNKMPFRNVEGDEGSLLILGGDATDKLHFSRISKALFFGQQNNNLLAISDATGINTPIGTTQGLDNYVTTYGNQLPYPVGQFDMDDFDALGEIFNREMIASKNILMPMAYNLHSQIDNTLKDYMDYTSFKYASETWPFKFDAASMGMNDPKDFFLWLQFSGLSKNSYHFLMKHQQELDEIQGAGTIGYSWINTGFALPVEAYNNPEGYENNMAPTIGYKYKALQGYSREMSVSWTGGAPVKARATSSLDAYQMDITSELGGDFSLGNQMIKIVPQ